jgi:uncharacterized OsmC-like protein
MITQETINGVNTADLKETISNIRQTPALGQCRFRTQNHWVEGGQNYGTVKDFYAAGQEVTSRSKPFEISADEPPLLLGTDSAPNPVEYLLTALASCMTTSLVYHAAAHGIEIDELESEFEGDLDLQGFLGLSKEVRPGYQGIRATFHVKSEATADELAGFTKFSPVYDVVSRSVPVSVNIVKK